MKKLKLFLMSLFFSLLSSLAYAGIDTIITFPEGSDGEVQFENDGLFAGDADFRFSTSTNRLSVSSMSVTYAQISTAAGVSQIRWADGTTQTTAAGAGGGDAYLGNTQTFTAPQTFSSSATFKNSEFSIGGSTFMTTGGSVSVGNSLGIGLSNPTVRFHVNTPGYDVGINNNGYLGIGVTNAEQSLYVSGGNAYISGFITAGGTGTVVGNTFSVGGSSFVVTQGKLGLGTTAPAYALHIATAAGVGGTLFSISTGGVTMIQLQGDGEIIANKFTGDGSGLTGIAGTGDAILAATQTFSGNDTFNIPVGSTMTLNGNVKSSGVVEAAYFQGNGSRLTGISAGGGDAYLGNTQTFTAPQTFSSSVTITNQGFSVGGSTFVVKNGLVGIGTSAPVYGLDIETSAYFANGAEFGTGLNAWTTTGTSFQIGVNGSVPLTLYTSSGSFVGTLYGTAFVGDGSGLTSLAGTQVGSGVPAANIASGSLGSSVIASSITLAAMYGAPALTGTNFTGIANSAIDGSSVTKLGPTIDLSGAEATGILADARFPALSGDVTTSAGSVAATIADNSVDGTDIALGSDAQGDIMYYDGTNYVRLPKGSAGQVLEMNAGATAPEWDTDDTAAGGGDNMGDHSSTKNVVMNGFAITDAGYVGIGTSNPSAGMLDIRKSSTTGGALADSGAFIRYSAGNPAATDIRAGLYVSLIETGTVNTGGNVGHNLGAIFRSSDNVNSAVYTFGSEGRVDAFGKATNYIGNLGMVIGSHPTGSTSTFVGQLGRVQLTTDGSTANPASTGTAYAFYAENVIGGTPGLNYGWYQAGSDDLNYFAGKVGIGAFAATPTDALMISDSGSPTISVTGIGPLMQSKWQGLGTSSMTWWGTTTNHPIAFYNNSTERVRISTAGRMGVGTTTPSNALHVVGGILASSTVTASAFYDSGGKIVAYSKKSFAPLNITTSTLATGATWFVGCAPSDKSITLTRYYGGSFSVAASTITGALYERSTPNGSNTNIFSTGISSATWTGTTITSFGDASIAAGSCVYWWSPGGSFQSGSPYGLGVTLEYTIDP